MPKTYEFNKANTLPTQFEFALADPVTTPYPAIVGGYGSGKTMSIPLRWLNLIEYRGKQGVECDMFVVEPTYKMVKQVAVKTFNKFFKQAGIRHKFHKTDHEYSIWYRKHRFTCLFQSAERPDSIAGTNKTDCIIDEFDLIRTEQDQQDVYNQCMARLRDDKDGTLGIVTTPEGFKYTYELYQDKHAGNPKYKMIKAKTTDNFFLPQSYIDGLYSQYDALLVQRYINGEFVNLNNSMAYYSFNRDRHVQPCPKDTQLPFYFGIDFNVNPMTSAVMQIRDIDGVRHYYVTSEYRLANSNTRALGNLIANDYAASQRYACPDMTGGARKTSADMTDIQILTGLGFEVLGTRNITERARLNIVNNLLDKNRLHIDPSCKHLINDMEKVTTNEYGQVAKEKDSQLTHISDALGYACVALEYQPKKWGIR